MKHGLSQNQLKVIAAAAMLLDHIGVELFPQVSWLRVIGRFAFPIFSYFIYEGFYYTRDRKRYFLRTLLLGLLCVAVYYLYSGEIYANVLITFSLSLLVLHGVETGRKYSKGIGKHRFYGLTYAAGCIVAALMIDAWIPVDYGMVGVLLPAFAEIPCIWNGKRNRYYSIAAFGIGLALLSAYMGGRQYFSLAAIPLLLTYTGRRGTANLKQFFYWFYPAHLAAIGVIAMFI